MTLRFFAKRLFSRGLWSGLYSVGFRVAWLVVRPFFLSAFVSRGLWPGLLSNRLPYRVAWESAFFCRLPCRVTRGLGLCSVGFRVARLVARPLCHWAVVIAGATAFAAAGLGALFIAGAALWIYNPILTRLIGRK